MNRRDFMMLTTAAMGTAAMPSFSFGADRTKSKRPNILWISIEDISPDLGCYGDEYAVTPNIDAFAEQATRFDNAYAHMGVCAPARSGIITGMYPTSIGTNHMRCRGVPPPEVKCFTEYLRAAGYYCSNRSKTDYQFGSPLTAWDDSSRGAHWHGRAKGRPFFSVINLTSTHESQIRNKGRRKQIATLGPDEKHDPAKAKLPPYYPDTPLVRNDWAQYYDIITLMDKTVAGILKQLEDDGLADDTIVWFWGDHGRGLPRGKRWIYDSGLKVPLIVRVPEKFRKSVTPDNPSASKPGTVNDDLVSFVDFAPTMLSLAAVPVPDYMQGKAFLGNDKARPRDYIFAARDRVDEAYDMIRAVRDKRYKYIRNFMPHVTRGLDVDYMNKMPTMREMRRLNAEGKLRGAEKQYFEPTKPIEELYDTQTDPHEVNNLADDPKLQDVLIRMRKQLFDWMKRTGDFGLIPEPEFDKLKRPGDKYEKTTAPGFKTNPANGTVEITCLTPGASIACRVTDGSADVGGTLLKADDADIHGKGPRRSNGVITHWRDENVWMSWKVEIEKPGRIPVHVCQARAVGSGRKYTLSVGDQKLNCKAQKTRSWDDYVYVKAGEVDIPRAGTYTVTIRPVKQNTNFSMNLSSVVLNGKDLPQSRSKKKPQWQVYAGPLKLSRGQRIQAKACRLGFRDSPTVSYKYGEPAKPPEAADPRKHWREVVDDSGVIDRCLELKRLDGRDSEKTAACTEALNDEAPAVRYWAILGLHHSPKPEKYTAIFRKHLKDPSAVVRIAAAQALCDLGEPKAALPVIVKELDGELSTGRLWAATALNRLGEKIRPLLPEIRRAFKNKSGYVQRMAKHTLK